MTVRVDAKVQWAAERTGKVYATLMPLVYESYAEMYGGNKDEAQHIPLDQFCSPKGRLFEVRLADDLVGMGGWSWIRYLGKEHYPSEWWEGAAEIKRVFIRREFRGHGLGRVLNEVLIEDARDHGVSLLVAETGEVQTEAVSLYHALGYEAIEPFGAIDTAVESCFFGRPL